MYQVPGEADIEHLTISPAHYINTAKMTSTVRLDQCTLTFEFTCSLKSVVHLMNFLVHTRI